MDAKFNQTKRLHARTNLKQKNSKKIIIEADEFKLKTDDGEK